jgi:hypothetical protein
LRAALKIHEGKQLMESEVQEVKTLTKELAEKYFRARFSVDLATFHYIEDEAAKIISKKENSCGLQLDGLCELSEKSAGFLARHVDSISLNGLPIISDSVALMLAKHKGHALRLNGLTSLSESVAQALGKYRGGLSLSGLNEITESQAKNLAKTRKECTGFLFLGGLKTISDGVALALSKHKNGCLDLGSLLSLSDKACDSLVKIKGGLSFSSLAVCSDAALDKLRAFADSGNSLYLSPFISQRLNDHKSSPTVRR